MLNSATPSILCRPQLLSVVLVRITYRFCYESISSHSLFYCRFILWANVNLLFYHQTCRSNVNGNPFQHILPGKHFIWYHLIRVVFYLRPRKISANERRRYMIYMRWLYNEVYLYHFVWLINCDAVLEKFVNKYGNSIFKRGLFSLTFKRSHRFPCLSVNNKNKYYRAHLKFEIFDMSWNHLSAASDLPTWHHQFSDYSSGNRR